jgi:high-affinity K+ transport system ATPase subunit B
MMGPGRLGLLGMPCLCLLAPNWSKLCASSPMLQKVSPALIWRPDLPTQHTDVSRTLHSRRLCTSEIVADGARRGNHWRALRGGTAGSSCLLIGLAFEMRTSATAGESTYAGIIKMVTSAQTAKAPFIRMADRFALLLLPVTLLVAGAAWAFSGDPIRGLAVLLTATPCPLILAAPVAFIAGAAQAARRSILIKGGGPLEGLARTHTVMFDKTGILTVGGARLVAVETAPGQDPDELLRFAASLEQASHHVVAAAIVSVVGNRHAIGNVRRVPAVAAGSLLVVAIHVVSGAQRQGRIPQEKTAGVSHSYR